jgi:hypothetical protein
LKKITLILITLFAFIYANAQDYTVPRGLPYHDTRWIENKGVAGASYLNDSLIMFRNMGDTQMKPLYPAMGYIQNFAGDSTFWIWDMVRWKKLGGGGAVNDRFGIEDNLGIQDRAVDMQEHSFILNNSPYNGFYDNTADALFEVYFPTSGSAIYLTSAENNIHAAGNNNISGTTNNLTGNANTIRSTGVNPNIFIEAIGSGSGAGKISIRAADNTPTTGAVLHTDFITNWDNTNRDFQFPKASGTFVLSVNGNLADSTGNVTISTGSGTVTSFSAGNLSPLFTSSVATSTTTPALTFSLTNAAGGTVFGNNTSSSAAPAYTSVPVLGIAGTTKGTIGLAGNTSGVVTVQPAAAAGTWTFTLPTTGGTNNYVLTTNGSGTTTWTDVTTIATGTVTSVAATAASGMTVTGSPITTSGTLAFAWTGAAQGDVPFFSAANTISFLNKSTTANQYLKNSGTSNNPAWATIAASDIGSGAALTKTDDANVTLTLGGTPTTALLAATSLTMGWTGQLSVARGGTGQSSFTDGQLLIGNTSGNTLTKATLTAGTGISVTNGNGSITIAASGGTSVVFDSLTWIDAQNYGILPTNSEATNTTNAATAMTYLTSHGGGTLYFKKADSAYKVRIVIPAIASANIVSIRILGATPPEQRAGTAGDNTANPLPTKGVILQSSSTSATAVISVGGGSSVTVTLENLDIRTYDAPQISGVDLNPANRCYINNCFINTNVYSRSCAFPATLTYGVRMPGNGNGANLYITNTTISGYYIGLEATEHTCGDNVNIYACVRGVNIIAGNHSVNFGRLGVYDNTSNVYVTGASAANITDLNSEHAGAASTPVWQRTVYDLNDSANLLLGHIKWWTVASAVYHTWLQNGGTAATVHEISNDWSSGASSTLTYSGRAAIGTTTLTDANGNVALNVRGVANTDIISATDGTATFAFYINNAAANGLQVQMGTVSNHNYGIYTNNSTPQVNLMTDGSTTIGSLGTLHPNYFRTTNAGSDVVAKFAVNANNTLATAGSKAFGFDNTNGFTFQAANGTRQIARAAINITSLTNTAGSEAGDLSFYTQSGGTAIAEKMRVTSGGGISLTGTNTTGGTTGNQTINKPTGTVNIAATGTTVTVTNSLVTTSSLIFCEIRTNDATARIANVVPGSGSFVINLTAAATAEISIGFFVVNNF